MAITFGAAGAAATGTSSISVAYPTGISAGHLLVLVLCNKLDQHTPTALAAPWQQVAQIVGGTGPDSNDAGPTCTTVWVKVADGTESGTLAVAVTSGNSMVGRMLRYAPTSADYVFSTAVVTKSVNTPAQNFSEAFASDPGVKAGDMVLVVFGYNTDNRTFASESLTQSGITYGTMAERVESICNLGWQCGVLVTEHPASTGTSSGNATWAATANTTPTSYAPSGGLVMLRIRETLTSTASGIAESLAFGGPTMTIGAISSTASGLALNLDPGSPVMSIGALASTASGIAESLALGGPTMTIGAIASSVAGIAEPLAPGSPAMAIGAIASSAEGLAVGLDPGSPVMAIGSIASEAAGLEIPIAPGSPIMSIGAIASSIAGLAVGIDVGQPGIWKVVLPSETYLASVSVAPVVATAESSAVEASVATPRSRAVADSGVAYATVQRLRATL